MLILEDHFNECMKLVCKSEGAINATSPLIDSEYLGKFEMLGMNMKCSLIQSEKDEANLLTKFVSNFDL